MRDIVVIAVLILSFAFVITVHISIAFGLMRREPRWHGLVGFVVPLAGVYWAWRASMRKRAWMWMVGTLIYVVALVLAYS